MLPGTGQKFGALARIDGLAALLDQLVIVIAVIAAAAGGASTVTELTMPQECLRVERDPA